MFLKAKMGWGVHSPPDLSVSHSAGQLANLFSKFSFGASVCTHRVQGINTGSQAVPHTPVTVYLLGLSLPRIEDHLCLSTCLSGSLSSSFIHLALPPTTGYLDCYLYFAVILKHITDYHYVSISRQLKFLL